MKHNLIQNTAFSLSLILGISTVCSASDAPETKVTAVLKNGVDASTSTPAEKNSTPILMHLKNCKNLPLEWQSDLKDAAMLGKCYGDLSSEKVVCSLHSLTVVKADGSILEKGVEGWIVGEDGAPGIKGKLLDRAEKERQAFLEVVKVLQESDLKREFSEEVSNARAKISDYCKKYAESLSPVISVDAGRVVEVVFKKISDLHPNQKEGGK